MDDDNQETGIHMGIDEKQEEIIPLFTCLQSGPQPPQPCCSKNMLKIPTAKGYKNHPLESIGKIAVKFCISQSWPATNISKLATKMFMGFSCRY